MNYISAHWGTIILGTWTGFNFVMNGIAQSLDAPTAQDTPNYRFWFKFINYCALNTKRANGLAKIEDSPNFVPAAEAYMKQRLTEQTGANKPQGPA